MKKLLVLSVVLTMFAQASWAAGSVESLWGQAAKFENTLKAALPGDAPDPAAALRVAKRGVDQNYRLEMDYGMLHNTAAEVKTELSGSPKAERVEYLMKFLSDALPVEGDKMQRLANSVDYLSYEMPAKPDAELKQAVKDLDAGMGRTLESVRGFEAKANALKAAVTQAGSALGERTPWLAEKLVEDAAAGTKYFDYYRQRMAKIAAR
ncbi:MAG: hypothetical protein WC728_02630 [Elusimicrobiota bacterium]